MRRGGKGIHTRMQYRWSRTFFGGGGHRGRAMMSLLIAMMSRFLLGEILGGTKQEWIQNCDTFVSRACSYFGLPEWRGNSNRVRPVTSVIQCATADPQTHNEQGPPRKRLRAKVSPSVDCIFFQRGSRIFKNIRLAILPEDDVWQTNNRRFRCVSDSQILVDTCCGRTKVKFPIIHAIYYSMEEIALSYLRGCRARFDSEAPIVWRSREYNREADALANFAFDYRKTSLW